MRQLVMGVIIGSVLTGGIVWGGQFYDSHGKPNAPSGSVAQFDYFRMRQQQIDVGHMRDLADKQAREQRMFPCRK